MATSLFDKYGGIGTISKAVELFYDKIQDTPQLDKYFEHTDMGVLIKHQTNFLAMVLGGPANQYTGRTLKAAHTRLNITPVDFGKVAELLQETLVESGVEQADIETIMKIVGSTKDDIVAS